MTRDQVATLQVRTGQWGIALSDEVLGRLSRFLDLLEVWNRRLRMTGDLESDVLVRKHALDSLAAARYLPHRGTVVDIGSGGGFPGIILGCLRTDLEFVLLDARRRSVSFLREAIRTIPLPRATAIQTRAESAPEEVTPTSQPRMVIARGLKLDYFLKLARPLLSEGSIAVAMQTPHARDQATHAAQAAGLVLADAFYYDLMAGEARALYAFRADGRSWVVP